jgi:hypothetical protein
MKTHTVMLRIFAFACILLSASRMEAATQGNIGFKRIGPRIGIVDPGAGLDATAEFGLSFEFGEIVRQLHWDGSVSFWSSGRNYPYYDNLNRYYRYNWTLRDIVLRSGVNYHFTEGEWVPYAGGGLGLHSTLGTTTVRHPSIIQAIPKSAFTWTVASNTNSAKCGLGGCSSSSTSLILTRLRFCSISFTGSSRVKRL